MSEFGARIHRNFAQLEKRIETICTWCHASRHVAKCYELSCSRQGLHSNLESVVRRTLTRGKSDGTTLWFIPTLHALYMYLPLPCGPPCPTLPGQLPCRCPSIVRAQNGIARPRTITGRHTVSSAVASAGVPDGASSSSSSSSSRLSSTHSLSAQHP